MSKGKKSISNFIKRYNQEFSISLLQKLGILSFIAFFANHLNGEDSFPFHPSYQFPLAEILVTFFLGGVMIFISDVNFLKYKKTYFKDKLNQNTVIRFGLSTILYHGLLYLPIYFTFIWILEEESTFYDLITGLAITILLSCLAIAVFYAKDIYQLHKMPVVLDKITVKNGHKTTLVDPTDIAYFYSKHKVVYLVQTTGATIATDFTLNQLEKQLNQSIYFRANRQTLLHPQSINQVENIENGKLSVQLNPQEKNKDFAQIVISRYKKQAFLDWFQKKA